MSHRPKHFDEIISLFSASCPFGKLSVRQNVRSSKCPFGKTSVRQNDRRQNVRSAKCLSAKCLSAKCLSAKCLGTRLFFPLFKIHSFSCPNLRAWLKSRHGLRILLASNRYLLNNSSPIWYKI